MLSAASMLLKAFVAQVVSGRGESERLVLFLRVFPGSGDVAV
jgi:hypothetical protein